MGEPAARASGTALQTGGHTTPPTPPLPSQGPAERQRGGAVKGAPASPTRRRCGLRWVDRLLSLSGAGGGAREFAMEISLTSFGSSQILPFPHFSTEAASRFCSRRETPMATDGPAHAPRTPALSVEPGHLWRGLRAVAGADCLCCLGERTRQRGGWGDRPRPSLLFWAFPAEGPIGKTPARHICLPLL